MKMGRISHIDRLRITFQDGSEFLTLNVPKEGISAEGWKIIPLCNPNVSYLM